MTMKKIKYIVKMVYDGKPNGEIEVWANEFIITPNGDLIFRNEMSPIVVNEQAFAAGSWARVQPVYPL
jgi:hypothetical protein